VTDLFDCRLDDSLTSSLWLVVVQLRSLPTQIPALPRDVLLLLASQYLDDAAAGAFGRTAWMHLRALKAHSIKRPLAVDETLRVTTATECAEANKQAGQPTPAARMHPHTHLVQCESACECMLAKRAGFPSMAAFRAQ
jgi:hypothetical protein